MKELKNKLKSIVSTLNKQELDSLFPEIAEYLMKNFGIKAKGKVYLLNEIEFYYYDSLYDDIRSDSKTKHITYERTASAGSWFIHNYGVDLTFESDKEKGYGGGILIRSIEEMTTLKATTGPVNCVNELWMEAVDAFSPTAQNPFIIRVDERDIELDVPTTRIKVDKVDQWQSLWRFTVRGKKISK